MPKSSVIRATITDNDKKLAVEYFGKRHFGSVGAMIRTLIEREMKAKGESIDLSEPSWGGDRKTKGERKTE